MEQLLVQDGLRRGDFSFVVEELGRGRTSNHGGEGSVEASSMERWSSRTGAFVAQSSASWLKLSNVYTCPLGTLFLVAVAMMLLGRVTAHPS